ncbi:ATP-binding protein [uncultured Brachyspira sp.]|uniref:AAA family ATPase n=1 Tax=uncultured Brachyspira sp. TaxID=221953 RepID=UPI0026351C7D|nr:ATP-binding protein [uncultured Brachyspira sp.]
MQKIIIKNLFIVKDFEMEINKFNLIIGEQSSGKSTISKAIFFFKEINTQIKFYIFSVKNKIQYSIKEIYDNIIKDFFMSMFGKLDNIDDNLYLKYQYKSNTYIEIMKKNNSLNINYSENIIIFFDKLKADIKKLFETYSDIDSSIKFRDIFEGSIGEEINDFFENELITYYIPASRSSIALLNNQRTRLNYDTIDFIFYLFITLVERIDFLFKDGVKNFIKNINDDDKKRILNEMNNKIEKYICGQYFYDDMFGYIKLENSDKKIPIDKISSGQQEILWLLNVLLGITWLNKKNQFVIIEEPEAHLYPNMQKEIIDFIVNFMNITDSSILITTHSPYILTSTNNLLYAGKLKENYKNNKEDVEKINNIIGEYGSLNPNEINAFKLYLNDFRYANLINEENEINCEEIDDISNTINETYTKLFDMELNNE